MSHNLRQSLWIGLGSIWAMIYITESKGQTLYLLEPVRLLEKILWHRVHGVMTIDNLGLYQWREIRKHVLTGRLKDQIAS